MTSPEPEFTIPDVTPDPPRDAKYDRLGQALREIPLSQSALSTGAGIDQSVLSRAMTGAGSLERHWARITSFLYQDHGIAMEWLLSGLGPMRQGTRTPAYAVPALTGAITSEPLREVGTVTELGSFSESPPRTKTVPGELTALVQDSSMDPLIRAGQWVVLASAERPAKDGEIVLVRCKDGSAFVRRFRPHNGVVVLENVNQDRRYRAAIVSRGDIDTVNVVVGVLFE